MLYLRLLVSAIVLGCGLTLADDTDDTARRVVEGWNRHIKEKGLHQWEFEHEGSKFPYLQYGFKSILRDFSTLQLRGDQQFIDKTQKENEMVYSFDLGVGYDKLELFSKYHMSLLFMSGNGMTDIKLIGEVTRIKGTVTLEEGGRCIAVLDSVKIESLGSVDVTVRYGSDDDVTPVVIGSTAEYIINSILPYRKEQIEGYLQDYLKSDFEEEKFSRNLCQSMSK